VATALFRIRLPGGELRWARGTPEEGPGELLAADVRLDALLGEAGAFGRAAGGPSGSGVPPGSVVVAPVESQEIWAAGVTYLRSRDARIEESLDASPYDRVYTAERPELFFKSAGWRVRGPGEPIAVRRDSPWNTPEPELTLVLDAAMDVVAFTIGDDVSSRTIEGENPLYLPQAKVYDGSCAIGPCLVPASEASAPFGIHMEIERDGGNLFRGETSTAQMRRSFEELAAHLGSALSFPSGAFLLTGTALVPDPPFTLTEGDVVRIRIDGLGCLENPVVVAGAGATP
jgi:2-dehydro-3-deoxy-D-arabinonate dehydratase